MIAALLAIPATPVNAVTTAACPATVPSAGFTDLAGFSADVVDGANCLAFYGITKGTSATTYGPAANVSRWQMALFLTRQAVDHGVTLPSGADQGFTDLTGLSAEAVTAVNQLAQLNITKGTSATTFDPNGNVGRWQMALFITRLVTGAGITLQNDYVVYAPSAGFTYDITKDMYLRLGLGYYKQVIENEKNQDNPFLNGEISKTWNFQRGSINLTGLSGLSQNDFGAQNIGFEQFAAIQGAANYNFTHQIVGDIGAYYRYAHSPAQTDEDDEDDLDTNQ